MSNISNFQVYSKVHGNDHTIVFRGTRISDGASVVIKTPAENSPAEHRYKRLRREFQIGKRFDSPYVAKYLELVNLPSGLALIMEDIGATSLKYLIPEQGLPVKEFLAIAIPMAQGLVDIHRSNVVHKDIKPGNVIINKETNEVRFIDFGISSKLREEFAQPLPPNRLEGTLTYISPEQTGRMNRPLDYRTDFYSLGITFFEMLSGRPPFKSDDSLELIHNHMAQTPPPLHTTKTAIPEGLSDIVAKLLSKAAEMRYQSAEGILADLKHCQRQMAIRNAIPAFDLAREDISERFSLPKKLYGRDQELAALSNIFAQVAKGGRKFSLVCAPAGYGKSALIHELERPLVGKRGFFISGKFDRHGADVPYSGVQMALRQLIRHLLGEDEHTVLRWKRRLKNILGINSGVIAEIIPDLELILGKCPPSPKLAPSETRRRFHNVFGNFVASFASKKHPLILFLDNLQWADGASFELIHSLMTNDRIKGLFVIGACREIRETGLLRTTLDSLEASELEVPILELQALDIFQLTDLVAETLHSTQARCRPLAQVILAKTQGNPYFTYELLKSLHQSGLIRFDHEHRTWNWQLGEIEAADISQNMANLIISRLDTLKPSSREALRVAACIGTTFSLSTLADITGLMPYQTALALRPALEEGLVIPLRGNYRLTEIESDDGTGFLESDIIYRFQHDRVHQAAYDLTPPQRRKEIHLRVSRHLCKSWDPDLDTERVPEVVHHLNEARAFITQPEERINLCRLNLIAGKRALDAVAYDAAFDYLTIARNELPGDAWNAHYDLTYQTHLHLAEATYLKGFYDDAERIWGGLHDHAHTTLDKVKIMELQMVYYITVNDLESAITRGLLALQRLKVPIPRAPGRLRILKELHKLRRLIKKTDLHSLVKAEEVNDRQITTQLDILMRLSLAAYFKGNRHLYALVALRRVELAITYGASPESANAFATFGLFIGGIMENYDEALRFGELALELDERFRYLPLRCKVFLIYGFNILPWHHHWKEMSSVLKKAVETGLQSGDYLYTSLACAMINHFDPTTDLENANLEGKRYVEKLSDTRIGMKDNVAQLPLRLRMALQGHSLHPLTLSGDGFNEERCLANLENSQFLSARALFYLMKLQQHYMFSSYQKAYAYFEKAYDLRDALRSTPLHVELVFYGFLTIIQHSVDKKGRFIRRYITMLRDLLATMQSWAKQCPVNFEHRVLLMQAEFTARQDQHWEAIKLYRSAVNRARDNEYIPHAALAAECAGRFLYSTRQEVMAMSYLQQAESGYQRWCALAKVKHLRTTFPKLQLMRHHHLHSLTGDPTLTFSSTTGSYSFSHSTGTTESHWLDLDTVIKAATALSSQIDYQRLLDQILQTSMSLTGSDRAILVYERSNQLIILAQAKDANTQIENDRPLDQSNDVPARLIRKTFTEGLPFIIGSHNMSEISGDPYFHGAQILSLLCMPIRNKDRITGVLCLEDRQQHALFDEGKVEWLKLFLGQAAISLENARLFATAKRAANEVNDLNRRLGQLNEELEERVRQRTQEIKKVQDELQERAHQAGMAEIATSVLQNVGSILNSVNTSAQTIQSTIQGSRVPGALLQANELLRENMDDYETFICETPKGQDLLRYYLKLDEPYQRDKGTIEEEAQRLITKVERIRSVIMAQQSYARGGYKLEKMSVGRLIEDALNILSGELSKHNIEVERFYDPATKHTWPKNKILHLLIDLIRNAIEAMAQHENQGLLKVTVDDGDPKNLVITIRDNGAGIPEEAQASIFNHGYTTKDDHKGFGLHAAANVMSELGGRINLDASSPESGTTFSLHFPK